jgi:hypothetical protein
MFFTYEVDDRLKGINMAKVTKFIGKRNRVTENLEMAVCFDNGKWEVLQGQELYHAFLQAVQDYQNAPIKTYSDDEF